MGELVLYGLPMYSLETVSARSTLATDRVEITHWAAQGGCPEREMRTYPDLAFETVSTTTGGEHDHLAGGVQDPTRSWPVREVLIDASCMNSVSALRAAWNDE